MEAREWGGLPFRHVGVIAPERDAAGTPLEFSPQDRYVSATSAKLNPHGAGPFCRFRVATKVREAGVYVVTSDDEVRYVGIATDLAERWGPRGYASIQPRNCFVGGQSTNCKINAAVLRETKAGRRLDLYFATVENRHALEDRLIIQLRPPWNGRGSGFQ